MPQDTSTAQSDGESPLDATEDVSGVHNHPSTTSTMNDASSFEPMPLGMEFDGEVASDAANVPASDLQNIYEGHVIQSFAFQVSLDAHYCVKQLLTPHFISRKLRFLVHPRRIPKKKIESMFFS